MKGIRNAIPRWIIVVWIMVGLTMLMSSIGWELLNIVDNKECYKNLPCFTFDLLMFFNHILGIFVLVMGMLTLIGNENLGTKEMRK